MPRPWFQFRLPSLLLAVLVTAVLMWLNFGERDVWPWSPIPIPDEGQKYRGTGWPVAWRWEEVWPNRGLSLEDPSLLVFDMLVCVGCAIAALVLAEIVVRFWRVGPAAAGELAKRVWEWPCAERRGPPAKGEDEESSHKPSSG
jgi:hypothetical protein